MFFGLKTVFFELLHAKPCRIIWKLPQKVNLGSETRKIELKHYFLSAFLRKLSFSYIFWQFDGGVRDPLLADPSYIEGLHLSKQV